jgi:hypothetical protein
MKLDREELRLQMNRDIALSKEKIAKLMDLDLLDEDGYPTEAALEIVEIWHWTDSKGWFEFIKSLWNYASWGWGEYDEPHEIYRDEIVHRYDISTAGWSGNESIIRAMQKNEWMWHQTWVQSRRGGHYIFELKTFEDD